MKKTTRVIQDPDVGPIQLPETLPESRRQQNLLRKRIREKILKQVAYRKGRKYDCPECGRAAMESVSDLSVDLLRGSSVVVVTNLAGARCTHCGAEALEPREIVHLDDLVDDLAQPDEVARVTRIGKGTVGTYWPKAVERELGLEPGDALAVRLLTRSTALIRVERRGASRSSRRKPPSK